jgi:hypothetical protein
LKLKFQHIFPGIITQVRYYGSDENLCIWVDCLENQTKKWFEIQLSNEKVSELTNPFPAKKIYQWIDAHEQSAFFSEMEQGKNPKAESVLKIDLKTGTVLEKMTIFSSNLNPKYFASQLFSVQTPTHYPQTDSHFGAFQTFFQKKFSEEIDKGIDYLEANKKLIFSYYLYKNTWVNRLKVCNLSFEILWEDELERNDLMGHTTFQMVNQLLVYTKNKKELVILSNE